MTIQINGTSGISGVDGTAGTPALQGTDSNTGISFGTDEVNINTGGSTRATVDSSGRVLVGTSTAPSVGDGAESRVVVQGKIGADTAGAYMSLARGQAATALTSAGTEIGQLIFSDSTGGGFASIRAFTDAAAGTGDYPGRLVFSTTADGASSPTERMRINSQGYLMVDSDGQGHHVAVAAGAGTSTEIFIGAHTSTGVNGGTTSFKVWSNGNVVNTNNSYGSLSDAKLKENIVDANSQWDDLKAIQVRNYNFKGETGQPTHTQIGVIAQEIELVSPGLVSDSPDFDEERNDLGTVTKSVNYSVLYMKAVKALQEAMERIETLEASNADLAARLTALEGGAA